MQAAPPNADELLPGDDARLRGIFSNCVYLHIESLAGRLSERVSNDSLCMNLCHFTPVCCLVVLKGRQPKACSQVAFQLIPPTSWKNGAGKKQKCRFSTKVFSKLQHHYTFNSSWVVEVILKWGIFQSCDNSSVFL